MNLVRGSVSHNSGITLIDLLMLVSVLLVVFVGPIFNSLRGEKYNEDGFRELMERSEAHKVIVGAYLECKSKGAVNCYSKARSVGEESGFGELVDLILMEIDEI